jgi:uncharacterized protein
MLEIDDLSFIENEEFLRVSVLKQFYVDIPKNIIIDNIGEYGVIQNKLLLKKHPERTSKVFLRFFTSYKRNLTFKLNNNLAIYIDESLGVPLIGLNFIGIVDKGTEMIEIKPITNCNTSCIFCSVNEGFNSKKEVDFVVDKDFLVSEINALLDYKESNNISIWINPHGEPLLYPSIVELIDNLLFNNHIKEINIVTNGILLDKNLVDKFVELQVKHKKNIKISLSISALGENSKKIMGLRYDSELVIRNLNYASKHLSLTITPVYMHGLNDDDIEKIIDLAKENDVAISIQKYCSHKLGNKPINEQSWNDFFLYLKTLEIKKNIKLVSELGKIIPTKELPLVCKKGQRLNVRVICTARIKKDKIALLETSLGSRAVLVLNSPIEKGNIKATVIQDKHNLVILRCK